ncbi:MAG TPA: hypothetical protein VG186_05300 [Solirubrobacteraceae bacterium]|jgi:hypothetical protein|nr:hypothetical protein [Solirubrobacteraceae bacterium]
MLVAVLTYLAAGNPFPTIPFLTVAAGFVIATFGHIYKSRPVIVVGLLVIAGVSVYVLYMVRPP